RLSTKTTGPSVCCNAYAHALAVSFAMPSWELFDRQSNEYKESVLPSSITKRVSLEMGVSLGWERYVGQEGKVLSIETFGASGTGAEVMNLFGFTIENVVQITKNVLNS
ncbi:transketolase-like TK C-terminal-containing protein, partial [Bacillus sp. SS-TM]